MNVRTGWHYEEMEGSSLMTGRHAALDNVVPYYAWVPSHLCSTLTSTRKHRRSKLLTTLRDQTKALPYSPDDCSAYARVYLLYNCTTAVLYP
jgi:hypothetical protein